MKEENCDHYWVLAGPQAVGHLTKIEVRCLKCRERALANLI